MNSHRILTHCNTENNCCDTLYERLNFGIETEKNRSMKANLKTVNPLSSLASLSTNIDNSAIRHK